MAVCNFMERDVEEYPLPRPTTPTDRVKDDEREKAVTTFRANNNADIEITANAFIARIQTKREG